ncbi:MAG: hypothetical protein FJ026_15150 [Chloroflexi bacterium]|nr:hypothetical protein [Chloroflexota bacterium]
MDYEERDVTANAEYMQELKQLMGRFVTPTIVMDKEVFLGFGPNLQRIQQLVGAKKDEGE